MTRLGCREECDGTDEVEGLCDVLTKEGEPDGTSDCVILGTKELLKKLGNIDGIFEACIVDGALDRIDGNGVTEGSEVIVGWNVTVG